MQKIYFILFLSMSLYADINERVEKLESIILKLQAENKKVKKLEPIISKLQSEQEETSDDENYNEYAIKLNGYINSHYTNYAGSSNTNKEDGFRLHRLSFIPHQTS